MANPHNCVVFVQNCPATVTDTAFQKFFSNNCSGFQSAHPHRKEGELTIQGFVNFNTPQDALECIRMLHGATLQGSALHLTIKTPRQVSPVQNRISPAPVRPVAPRAPAAPLLPAQPAPVPAPLTPAEEIRIKTAQANMLFSSGVLTAAERDQAIQQLQRQPSPPIVHPGPQTPIVQPGFQPLIATGVRPIQDGVGQQQLHVPHRIPVVPQPPGAASGHASPPRVIPTPPLPVHATPPQPALLVIDGSYFTTSLQRLNQYATTDFKKLVDYLSASLNVNFNTRKWWFDSKEGPEDDWKANLYRVLSTGAPAGPGIITRNCGEFGYKRKTMICCKSPTCIHKNADGTPTPHSYRVQKGTDGGIVTKLLVTCALDARNRDFVQTVVFIGGDSDFSDAFDHMRNIMQKNIVVCGFNDRSVSVELQQFADKTVFLDQQEHRQYFTSPAGTVNTPPAYRYPSPIGGGGAGPSGHRPPSPAVIRPASPQVRPQLPPPQVRPPGGAPPQRPVTPPEGRPIETQDMKGAANAIQALKPATPKSWNMDQVAPRADSVCPKFWAGEPCAPGGCALEHFWAPSTRAVVEVARICITFLQTDKCESPSCHLLHVHKSELHEDSMNSANRPAGAPKLVPVACFNHVLGRCATPAATCKFAHVDWPAISARVEAAFHRQVKKVRDSFAAPPAPIRLRPMSDAITGLCLQYWRSASCKNPSTCPHNHCIIPSGAIPGQSEVLGRICRYVVSGEECPVGAQNCVYAHIPANCIHQTAASDNCICPFDARPSHICDQGRNCSRLHIKWATLSRQPHSAAAVSSAPAPARLALPARPAASSAAAVADFLDFGDILTFAKVPSPPKAEVDDFGDFRGLQEDD